MRTEVKLGIITSLIVVLGAGWYYMRRSPNTQVIPLGQELADQEASSLDDSVYPNLDPTAEASPVDAFARRDTSTGLASIPSEVNPPDSRDPVQDLADADAQTDVDGNEGSLAALLASNLDDDGASADLTDSTAELTGAVTPINPSDLPDQARVGADPVTIRRSPSFSDGSTTGRQNVSRQRAGLLPPGSRTHTVQKGDTLAILAELYYGSQRYTGLLLEANPGLDPAKLLIGTVLNVPPGGVADSIPLKPAATSAASTGKTYIVAQGDSFYVIARDQLGDANRWPELLKLNTELVKGDPKKLRPGQVLRLPE